MAEVIMGMYQEMVVLREQAKPLVVAVVVGSRQSGKQKRAIQIALHNSELGAHERAKRSLINVVPCQSPIFDEDVLNTLVYTLVSR
jgi:hypothetical protein